MQHHDLTGIRNEYSRKELSKSLVDPDPLKQFEIWLNEALNAGIPEPTAMTLATVSADAQPSARMVLLKDFSPEGFTFYTNYNSRKADEISSNPKVALVFFWKELERQVRIEGIVKKLSLAESDMYFQSRPSDSRVSAIISPQSQAIPDRPYLEKRRDDFIKDRKDDFQRPDFWGGYRVIPHRIEFWQGRPGRLHDRILYSNNKDVWDLERLAP